jgi:anti-sigma regulatory factor (Ser/Thr protein kinase)
MPAITQRLRVPARLAELARVRQFVRGCALGEGLPEQQTFACELAADEAFVNIVVHAYGGESDEPVLVRCRRVAYGLVVSFVDEGVAWDPSPPSAPPWESTQAEVTVGGLGRLIIHRAMDGVRFSRRGGRNILTLCKFRPGFTPTE